MSRFSLQGQHVVIIGGSTGLGLATAIRAHEMGATVTIASRSAEKLAAAKARVGARCNTLPCEIADEESVRRLFEATGEVDHVFVTAAGHPVAKVREAKTSEIRSVIEERFWGVFYTCKYAQVRNGGSITLTTGIGQWKPAARGESVAVAGAGAAETFARQMARELSPIRVNTVAPGLIATDFARGVLGDNWDAFSGDLSARLPVRRIGDPEDVAHAVIFLMTNRYTTGSTLHVNGGYFLI